MVTCNMKVHKSLPVSSTLHDVKNIKRFPTYLKIVICILCVYSLSRIHRLKYIFNTDLNQVNHSTELQLFIWLSLNLARDPTSFHIFCPCENYNLQNTQMKCQSKNQKPFLIWGVPTWFKSWCEIVSKKYSMKIGPQFEQTQTCTAPNGVVCVRWQVTET